MRRVLLSAVVSFALAAGGACSSDPGAADSGAAEPADAASCEAPCGSECCAPGTTCNQSEQRCEEQGDASMSGADASVSLPDAMVVDYLTEEKLLEVTGELASPAFGGREEGSAGGNAARAYLIDILERCGVQPAGTSGFEQKITASGAKGTNVLGKIPGTDATLAERYVLVSAHYDHLGTIGGTLYPGAYDNASAVAIVVGVACRLAQQPAKRSVLVALWDAEEPPTFLTAAMGSEFFAAHPTVPLAQIDVAVVLDLIGEPVWPGYTGFFAFGSETSAGVHAAVTALTSPAGMKLYSAGLHLPERTPAGTQPWSDYHAFRNRSVPVVFLSDGQNRNYHSSDDTADKIDGPRLAGEAQVTLALAQSLAALATTPVFAAGGADYLADARMVSEVLQAAVASGGLVDLYSLSSSTRAKLNSYLAAAQNLLTKLEGGGTATASELSSLRNGAQFLMCLAGASYNQMQCNLYF